jgi:glucosamine kinase
MTVHREAAMTQYVVGVDGGGTKTTSAVIGADLSVAGRATTGPANGRSVGMDTASANVADSITAALHAAGATLADVSAMCMCLSGLDTELDLPVPQGAIRQLGFGGPAIIENDVVGAWAGATGVGIGLVVIAGTGATALGMNARGELWRTDGWDYILGDAGSGFAVGQAGIRTAMKALDGRAAPTELVRHLAETYGVHNAEEMRHLVDSTHFGKFEIARFAARVAAAADAGDAAAQALLEQAGRDLAENAVAIIGKLDMASATFPLATVGGMFKSEQWVAPPFRKAIAQVAPGVEFRRLLHPPEVGAGLLAMRRVQEDDLGSWSLGTGKRRIRRSVSVEEAASA